jgi:hypothetical protein
MGAAAVLLLNALIWQPLWPSWWTGKIGDAAWLVIVPLLAAVPLSAAPALRRLSPRSFGAPACLLTALAFAAAKTVPAVNTALLTLGASLGIAFKLRLDPTDLLALPAVLVAAWIWQHSPRQPRRGLQAAGLALAALAIVADVSAPYDFGINCLAPTNVTRVLLSYYAVHEFASHKPNKVIYRSDDGGLTWRPDGHADASKVVCTKNNHWPEPDPSSPTVQLYFVPGQGIYRSSDQAQTLQLEQPLKDVPDHEQDKTTGNLIIAAGTQGIWVKTPAGQWQQTLVLPKP